MQKLKPRVERELSSGSSFGNTTKKDALSSMQFPWANNAERSAKSNAQPRQDNASGLDRIEKSIWDLAENVKQEQRSQRPLFFRWTWARINQDARTVLQVIRSHPLVALIPSMLWMLLVGGGSYAVLGAASRESAHRRELAAQIATDKATFLATELAKVFMPAYVCSLYVRRDPNWQAINGSFAPMALEMIRLSNAGSILTLSLIPDGVIYTMVPLKGISPSDDPNWKAIGKDWLQDKFNEDKVLRAINTTELTIIGPYNLTQGGIGLVAMLSIRISAAPNDTFNTPPYIHGALGSWQTPPRVQNGPNTTDTPFTPYMYDKSTGSKWWGLTTVLISWDVLRERVMRLQDLETMGYRYVLSRPALRKELLRARPDLANGVHELAVAWSSSVQKVAPNATNNNAKPTRPGWARPLVYYDLHTMLSNPATAHVSLEGAEMTLFLEPMDGWVPSWRNPLLVVVAVGSLLVALMLLIILVNRRQHMGLLHAMIPKKVISTIQRGDIFTESFDCVTILFSDIVSYTSMSAQMAPIQVVQMLDELYKEYDNLTEKHKLYKVETIGDAFMVVGGAPDPMDPVEAARRVAQMALDMVELTRTRVLAGGQVLRIRVGIHSGPVVAAVVGRKMPRYCLFGDTVNTASRMESNGGPMRVHVSAATADLLREAGGFVLEARGDVSIKGKGYMSTYWVTGPNMALNLSGKSQDSETQNAASFHLPSSRLLVDPKGATPAPAQGKVMPAVMMDPPSQHQLLQGTADPSPGSGQLQPQPVTGTGPGPRSPEEPQMLGEPAACRDNGGGGCGGGGGVMAAPMVRRLPSTPRLNSLAVLPREPEATLDGCRNVDGEGDSSSPKFARLSQGVRLITSDSVRRGSSAQLVPVVAAPESGIA